MRHFSLSLIFLLVTTLSFGQCPAPEVSSWHFPDSSNVDIEFYADDDAETYQVIFTVPFNQSATVLNERDTIEGDVLNGITSFTYNVVDLLTTADINTSPYPESNNPYSLSIRNSYYKVDIRTTCGDNNWSEFESFYVSPFSLLNDPNFSFDGELKMPFLAFPDSTIVNTVVQFEIPEQTPPMLVEQLGVFIDYSHPVIAIASLELRSPSGTVVILEPNTFGPVVLDSFVVGNSWSCYYTDEALFPLDSSGYGIVLPDESLSELYGELASGTWEVRVHNSNISSSQGLLFGGRVFGVGLSMESSPVAGSIAGNAFYDFNSNGINDGNDVPFSYALIDDSGLNMSFNTNVEGEYYHDMPEGEGEISVLNPPLYYEALPAVLPYEVNIGDELTGYDFALTATVDINDLTVDMWPDRADVPGFSNKYFVHFQNIGTTCIDDVIIEVQLDSLLELQSSNASDYSIDGNTITINVGTVCPMESGTFTIYNYLSPTVSLGTILSSSASIYPIVGDENDLNNLYEFNSTVIGSFDPNDKQVNEEIINESFLENGEPLKYMVRFQNTGTYYAQNVVVTDTLDDNLDMSTFQMISTSHDMNITVEGRVLHFNFNDIMLPDSTTDLEGSNGYLRYSIAPYSDLTEGTLIQNTAYIYFDFNEAIITNTTETLVDFASGINEALQYEAKLYPNPASSDITVSWSVDVAVDRILIFDLRGKQVLAERISDSQTTEVFDISHLSRGAYVIQLIGDDLIKPVRWVKM